MNLDLALYYASIGCYVFPCISSGPRRKQPCGGLGWRTVSTTEEVDIRRLWARFPEAVPGIDMGKSGLITIDCDCKQSDGLSWISSQVGLDGVPGSITPSGGRHLIYRNTIKAGNSRGRLPGKEVADIDIRGDGGYIIAPGSVFSDGGTYEPIGDVSTATELPAVLIAYLERQRAPPIEADDFEPLAPFARPQPISDFRKDRYGQTALAELERDLASVPPGDRNNQATLIGFRVGQLVGGGCIDLGEAYRRLEAAVLSWGVSPRDKALGRRGSIWRAIEAGQDSPRGPTDDHMPISMRINFAEDVELEPEPEPTLPTLADIPGYDADWTAPEGLLGEIADYVMAFSWMPNRPLAVAAATSILSAVCGRWLFGPTGSAVNLYIVCIAGTGVGKKHPLSAPAKLLNAAGLDNLHQTGKVFSKSGMEQLVEEAPCCVATIDEIGASLLEPIMSSKSASYQRGIGHVLQELWSRGQGDPPYSMTRRSKQKGVDVALRVDIPNPSLTLLGATTKEVFWGSLSASSISDGFLNRILLCLSGPRGEPQDVPAEVSMNVPTMIVQQLQNIIPGDGNIGSMPFVGGPFDPKATQERLDGFTVRMTWADGVKARYDAVQKQIIAIENQSPTEQQELIRRVYEQAIRLASLHAVSRGEMEVNDADLSWGIAWAFQSGLAMIEGVADHMSVSDNQAIAKHIRRVLKEKGGEQRAMPAWKLKKALQHRYRKTDVDSVLAGLVEAGDLLMERKKVGQKNRESTTYQLPE